MGNSDFRFSNTTTHSRQSNLSGHQPVYAGYVKSRVSNGPMMIQDLEPNNSFRGAKRGDLSQVTKGMKKYDFSKRVQPLRANGQENEYCHQRVEVKNNGANFLAIPDSGRFYGSLEPELMATEKKMSLMESDFREGSTVTMTTQGSRLYRAKRISSSGVDDNFALCGQGGESCALI